MACYIKIGPRKIGSAGLIMAEKFAKLVPADHFCCQNLSGQTNYGSQN